MYILPEICSACQCKASQWLHIAVIVPKQAQTSGLCGPYTDISSVKIAFAAVYLLSSILTCGA